ncbi:hypothetical protein CLV58_103224 [Spirosoma oryzae]|uniref:Parallel beta helix pectate lyase-like protein n=1 Tax=Spirosoma oryzae TaxID=1469603 RepID=A0A2T0TF09_9BACT|nr:hypothetical protein [Spirosoma oryzae]PRY44255.1 hypothetical protein CLV58_103224 [Spirosoma oryzae]
MKHLLCASLLATAVLATLSGCNSADETVVVSQPLFKVGQAVSTKTPLSGPVKGTLQSDSTYRVGGDVYVNAGDTLVIQPGAKVYFPGGTGQVYSFIVHGTLLSLGTQAKPVYFTVPTAVKTDTYGADPTADPAYKGLWGGIMGETDCKNIILKWTHIEFGGGKLGTSPVTYLANGANSYPLTNANPDAIVVLEDSWVYGSVDDPVRAFGGRYNIMRNTFEKNGFTSGESMNIKSGSVGNFAYNLIVGSATNGPKASNNGGKNPQTSFLFYNNTMVACGYRRAAAGRGGSLNIEEGARGGFYNNLMVNCKYGPRVVGATANYSGNALVVADTANLRYSNNYSYVDSVAIANQIYPVGFATKPQTSDVPTPSSFLPTGYKPGQAYDGSAVVGKNNPMFVNFPLPQTTRRLSDVSVVNTFNFRLQSASPALGKGTTSFSPASVVPVSANFGSTEITLPSTDMGAFPANGKGNQH